MHTSVRGDECVHIGIYSRVKELYLPTCALHRVQAPARYCLIHRKEAIFPPLPPNELSHKSDNIDITFDKINNT